MAKVTYQEVRTVMDTVPNKGMQAHYVLGSYESFLANLIAHEVPAKRQQAYLDDLRRLAERASQVTP